jgi:replicative DNA helicase
MGQPEEFNGIDLHREKTILGALLLDGQTAMEQCLRLRPEMFGVSEHRLLFRTIIERLQDHEYVDALTLRDILQSRGQMGEIAGGIAALSDLSTTVPRRSALGHHVGQIVELWKRRRTAAMADRAVSDLAGGETADEVLARLQTETMELAQEKTEDDDPSILSNTIPELERWRDATQQEGIPYGLGALDRITGGMYPGEITVIGARNGVGKTSQLIQTAINCCRAGIPVDVFSLEMSRGALMRRIWAVEAKVAARVLRRRNEATPTDTRCVTEAAMRCAEWPLRIFDKAGMDVGQITAHARHGVRKLGVRVTMLDYAQICRAEGKDERLRIANVSRTMTAFAKDTGAHVLLLSQLCKVQHERWNKPPTLGDLRETGQLGDDAHCVLLYHRGTDDESGGLSYDGEIVIPKQRSGETRAIPVRFDPNSLTFQDAVWKSPTAVPIRTGTGPQRAY